MASRLDLARGLGVGDRVLGADRPGADDQRQAGADHLPGVGREVEPLLRGVGIVLAGRARDDDAVHPGRDQRLEDLGEGLAVDLAIGAERRDRRGVDSFEVHDDVSLVRGCRRFRPAVYSTPAFHSRRASVALAPIRVSGCGGSACGLAKPR